MPEKSIADSKLKLNRGKNFVYISNINMEIESQDLVYLQSRGFTGKTLEEAIEWFRKEHALTPIRDAADLGDLKQLILILKIRSL